jgi:hypothetical protein
VTDSFGKAISGGATPLPTLSPQERGEGF